jgi:hypothetical protein
MIINLNQLEFKNSNWFYILFLDSLILYIISSKSFSKK